MEQKRDPQLDEPVIERTARAVRSISDRELEQVISAWRAIVGVDLVMSRWMLHADERAAFDMAADAVRAASDDRIRAARRTIAPVDDRAHEKLAEVALGHLVASRWADRLTPDQKRRMGAAWRVVAPKQTQG